MPVIGNSNQSGDGVIYYQSQSSGERPRDGRRHGSGPQPGSGRTTERRPEQRPTRPHETRTERRPERHHDQYTEEYADECTDLSTEESSDTPSCTTTDTTTETTTETTTCDSKERCPAPSPECIRRRLMESIALEELAIAHLINAEAEKTQAVAHKPVGPVTADELVEVDRSVAKVLEMIVAKEELLLKKLRLLLAQEFPADRDGHRHHLEVECECECDCHCEADGESDWD